MSDEKTEIELGDIKLSGGKLLILLPILGAIGGMMWGGFELYQRLIDAEEAVISYVSPDFSSYDEGLAVLQARLDEQIRVLDTTEEALRQDIELLRNQDRNLADSLDEELDEVISDLDTVENLARETDDSVAATSRELRDDVYQLEERVNDSLREVNTELRNIRSELEDRIQQILDNPLNDSQ
tara:strand:+ start:4322 stop:4870 length:549 start_codon:yes stop_codon:yes gene_type:complete